MLSSKQKTLLYYALMALFAVTIIWLFVLYFLSAQLTITTSDASTTISLQEYSPTSRTIPINQNGNSATARVEAGTYIIVVKSNSSSAQQIVKLGVGEHKTVSLNPGVITTSSGNVIPVTTLGGRSISASNNHLSFIDYNDPNYPLYTVDTSNKLSELGGGRSFQSITWISADYGIGQVIKGSNSYGIALIQGSSATDIPLPFTTQSGFSFAVAPNKTLYVSDGHIIYRANGDGSYTKIYTSNSDFLSLSTASNKTIQFNVRANNSTRQTSIAVLHNDGTKYQISGEIYESLWSPASDKLILAGDDVSGVFNDQLKMVNPLPSMNIISPLWLDNNTILFIQGSDIWKYSLQDGTTNKIATIDQSVGNFSNIYLSDDHSYLYATVDRANFPSITFSIYRVSLQNQQSNTTSLNSLLLVLPKTDSACTINAVAFTSLSVVMKRNLPGSNCVAEAKDSIVGSKVLNSATTDTLNFQYLP